MGYKIYVILIIGLITLSVIGILKIYSENSGFFDLIIIYARPGCSRIKTLCIFVNFPNGQLSDFKIV